MKNALAPLVAIIFLASASVIALTQNNNDSEKSFKIKLHVTSVTRADDPTGCDPNECTATRFTVEGYAANLRAGTRTAYVLTCDEYLAEKPTPHVTIACSKVHANYDYDARVIDDSISFWPEEKYTPPPMRGVYSIVSEKEVKTTQ
jgi:hypothetical protein